jgi:hypothetical protein
VGFPAGKTEQSFLLDFRISQSEPLFLFYFLPLFCLLGTASLKEESDHENNKKEAPSNKHVYI